MDGLLDETDVLVCPTAALRLIAAAWERGFLPVVVPRLPQFGEHVDDHQLRFALKLAELGRIWLAQSAAEFTACLSDATRDPARLRANVPAAHTDAAVARFGELVEELVRRPRAGCPCGAGPASHPSDQQQAPASPPPACHRSRSRNRNRDLRLARHASDKEQ